MADLYCPTPNIDRMAMGGGFGTVCRPLVSGGDPPAILGYAAQLLSRVQALTGVLNQLRQLHDQLGQAWPSGAGAQAAARRMAQIIDVLARLIQAIAALAKQLQAAAGQLSGAATSSNSVIQATDPQVGALSANPYTQAAASALATGTTASLAAFLKAVGSLLTTIGQSNIGNLVSAVAGIVSGTTSTTTPAPTTPVPTTTTPTTTVSAPTVPTVSTPTVSTPAVSTPTVSTPAVSTPAVPTTATPATTVPATGTPATTAAAPGAATTYPYGYPGGAPEHHVTVTVNADGSVVVDADVSAQVDVVERAADGTDIDKHISVDASGLVTTG